MVTKIKAGYCKSKTKEKIGKNCTRLGGTGWREGQTTIPMLTGFIVVLALSARNYNTNNIYPILGHGLSKTITTGIMRSSIYGEIIILAIFAKAFQGIKYIKREGIISIGLSTLVISASLLAFTLTFPYYIAQELLGLVYQMAELIDYGPFFQRIEPITLFIWIISALISTTIVFYSFVRIFCKMFKIQDKNPVILGGHYYLCYYLHP